VVGTAAREYRTGERIFHPKFGEGTIVDVIERRGDQDLAIEFLRHGRKMFQASLAKLDLISD
jgi:PcrA/UvrD tudor domain